MRVARSRGLYIFGIIVVAISITLVVPTSAAGHLTIINSQNSVTGNSLNAQITVSGVIPIDGNAGAFGYAVETGSSTNNVLALLTHKPIDDSPSADELSGFHVHVLDLRLVNATDSTDPCLGQDAEIDTASSQQNVGYNSRTAWRTDGNVAYINGVPADQLNSGTVSKVVAFTINPFPNAYNPQHLCIDIVGSGVGQ